MHLDNQNILIISKDRDLYKLVCSFYDDVHYCASANEAISKLKRIDPLCVFCDATIYDPFWEINDGVDLFKKLSHNSKEITKILIQETDDFDSLERAINCGNVFAVIRKPFYEEGIKVLVQNAIGYADLLRENSILLNRAEIRKTELLRLKSFLEQKSKTGLKDIEQSFGREKYVKKEVECINRLLLMFPKLRSLKEMEGLIRDELNSFMAIDFVKISVNQSNDDKKDLCAVSSRLFCSGTTIGFLKFGRNEFPPNFTDDEMLFFDRVCEISSVYVEKLMNLSEFNNLKEQWESVFNSIDEPLSLINKDCEIIEANNSFTKTFSSTDDFICDASSSLESGEPTSTQIKLKDGRDYAVWTYPVKDDSGVNKAIQFYKDVSEQIKYKEGLVYSEKMAELGMLAGSVAHEINNPIGGVLAYLQMMIAEVDKDTQMFSDLVEMEKAASRCAHISKNLLHFSRSSAEESFSEFSLSSVFDSILPILKMQLRHEDIVFSFSDLSSDIKTKGVFNDLMQAFLNLFNFCLDAIRRTRKQSTKLEVILEDSGAYILCKVFCESGVFDKETLNALSLFVTERIIARSLGRLVIEDAGFSVYLSKSIT